MAKKKVKMILMLIFCILVILGIIIFISMIKSIRNSNRYEADNVAEVIVDNNVEGDTDIPIPSDMVIPTPEPSSELGEEGEKVETGNPPEQIVIMSGTSAAEEQAEAEAAEGKRYKAVKEDISWTDAQKAAKAIKGGHLMTVGSKDELQTLKQLLIDEGIDICWVGCHRDENGNYIWENDENIDIGSLGAWGYGEPSYTDQGKAEDYIMFWWMNGTWCFNDSEDDPVSSYPRDYSGKMGYIIEYDY